MTGLADARFKAFEDGSCLEAAWTGTIDTNCTGITAGPGDEAGSDGIATRTMASTAAWTARLPVAHAAQCRPSEVIIGPYADANAGRRIIAVGARI